MQHHINLSIYTSQVSKILNIDNIVSIEFDVEYEIVGKRIPEFWGWYGGSQEEYPELRIIMYNDIFVYDVNDMKYELTINKFYKIECHIPKYDHILWRNIDEHSRGYC